MRSDEVVLSGWSSVDQFVGAAVDEVDVRADRIGIVVQRELGRAQLKLIGLVVEVIELVDLVEVAIGWCSGG